MSRRKNVAFLDLIKVRLVDRATPFIWATIIGVLIASRGLPTLTHLFYALLTAFFVVMAVYIYNDVMDYEYDKLNELKRPVATGEVTRIEATILALSFASIGIVLSIFANKETLLLVLLFLTLGFLYSTPPIRLKHRYMAKPLVTAIGGFICSLLGGSLIGNFSIQVIYAAFIFFMLLIAGSSLADLTDIKGDKTGEVKNLTVLYGPRFAIKFAIAVFLSVIAITVIGYPFLGFNVLTPIIVTGGGTAFVWFAYSLLHRWQDPLFCRNTIRKMIAINFLFQISFVLGVL